MIKLTNASRIENNRLLINDVSALFHRGSLVSVLSERHSELTSFLNLLNGTQKLSSGLRESRGCPKFATAFDLDGVVSHLTVRQNVRIGPLRMLRRTQDERNRLWNGLKLQHLASLPASSLSPPDQSALVLLRCLQQDVPLYQVSSCMQYLRPDVIDFALDELRRLSMADKLVFIATENEHFATKADRVIVLRNGSVSLDKPTNETNSEEIRRQMVNNSAHRQYLVSEFLTRRANHSVDPVDLSCQMVVLLRDVCQRKVRCAIVTGPEHSEQAVDGDGRGIDPSPWRAFLESPARQQRSATEQFEFHHYQCQDYDILFVLDQTDEVSFSFQTTFAEFDRAADAQHQLRTLRQTLEHVGRLDSLGRLAGGVAHDVNNSISPVMVSVDLLQADENMPESASVHLETISQSVARMESLSQRLVEFSRNGRMQTAAVDFGELVEETGRMLQSTIGRNIILTTRIADEPMVVMGDRQQLENAIINLGINSRDAMPEGGELLLDLQFDSTQRSARLIVTDTGTGMSPAIRRRAFEPFFTTKGASGTGLGLSSVGGIISDHDGIIRIVSTSEEGTTIEFRLPLSDEVPELPVEAPIHSGSGELVLIVDDESIVRDVLVRLTRQLGYSVLSAGGTEEALSIFRERHNEIGLILMDVTMPGMSGVDCLLELRNISSDLSVILMTGHTDLQLELSELRDAGLRGILRKPFSKQKLAKALFEHASQADRVAP